MNWKQRVLGPCLCLGIVAATAATVPWEDLTESDWLYSVATRFALVDGHQVHYPTPTAELVKALEGRQESGALRQLADARLALGDRKGALEAIQKWAGGEKSGAAWDEAARWAASHQEMAVAFPAAEKALLGLPDPERRALADERVAWADRYPGVADPIVMRQARATLFPQDGALLEEWVRALEKAGRLPEADKALDGSRALSPERRLLLRSDLAADHEDPRGAFLILDAAVEQSWSLDFRRAYAKRIEKGAPSLPAEWRATLESRYDAAALVRLATCFEGQERGDAASGLLDQVERRYSKDLGRKDDLLLARLRAEVDAIPEAFRDTLAAAQQGNADEQADDLAALANLALRAGGRPLPWGTYNDESYRWAANADRAPGFWTGGLSFFLTGQNWKDALDRLESESLPDRTFAIARALTDLLAQRAPKHAELPALRAAIMDRFVERGEGRQALAMLPQLESAPPAIADEGRRIALLAARQVDLPLNDESRLFKARLAHAAADGSRPALDQRGSDGEAMDADAARPWSRVPRPADAPRYGALLEEAITRLDSRDPSHRASLDLVLTELDRLPDDEPLWLSLASRLESWDLDDDLGPRLDGALKRFQGAGIWDKAARWYARRNHQSDLRKVAADVAARFRGTALFERADADVLMDSPEQGRMVAWADWVRLKALERFPHSPKVFAEASRLVPASVWQKASTQAQEARHPSHRVVVGDALLQQRAWAILFVDAGQREAFFAQAMKNGALEAKLAAMETKADRTPVEDELLFEGWARLSQFERAMASADRLAAAYPGDGDLAQRVLSLHRSLNGLDGSQASAARALVERTAPALENANPLWTELGELEEDRDHSAAAIQVWQHLVEREPRNPERVSELATLLWDYNHDQEALAVVEQGRRLMARPRFFAFETGVLRENVKDINGAIREYLDALEPEDGSGYGSSFEQDQRSLRRLAQLIARDKVYRLVAQRIQDLKPGAAEDEHELAAFFPMATIETPAPGLEWDADDWIDGMDQPNDPVGREHRAAAMAKARPGQHDAIARIGDLMLLKTREMAAKSTTTGFLDVAQSWSQPLVQARWKKADAVDMQNTLQARRAQLAPTEEDRIQQEMARATYLADNGRRGDADAVWTQLAPRITALPEGPTRMRAEAQRAAFLERSQGAPAAAQEWQRLSARYPWSLGVLQDRAAFLARTGQGEQARALIEVAIPKAGAGHREALLEQLTQDSLGASDLPRARRAVTQLLGEEGLEDDHRLGAVRLLARLSWRENAQWDPAALIQVQKDKLKPELLPDLYHELARAADLEGASAKALPLWIEALNRRTGRDWIQEAARATRKAGTSPQLLAFFEKQQARSPRDVRWAVAVRDIRRDTHDVDGAIEAAKAAVAVRPEEELLWREAADMMVRAGRVTEAADYLAGWNKPRPADEGVAGWRSGLYSQAGDGTKAFAIEQAALRAFAKTASGNDLKYRKARAVGRLMEQGHPDLALQLGSPRKDIRDLDGVLSADQQCRLALLVNQFPQLLRDNARRDGFLDTAASVLQQDARVEWLEQARAFVLGEVQSGDAALQQWSAFITGSGLESQVRLALGQSYLATQPGPWQAGSSVAFAESVGAERVGWGPQNHMVFRNPDMGRLWARDLVRRDEGEALYAYLQPRFQELLATVEGPTPLDTNSNRLLWASWLDDPAALDAWTRAAAKHPESAQLLGRLMTDRYHWDRCWVLAARGWQTAPIVSLLPKDGRMAWFRLWDAKLPTDPMLLARRKTVESVTEAVARLVQNAPGSADDPLIVKLRGPRTVGAVLGAGSEWVWPEFSPRRDAKGDVIETGDDRVTGQGVDAGRMPGALWGDRPGEAWYVLEALSRYREGDRTAPYLPLEASQRGAETARALLAIHMAKAMGDVPLAMEIEAAHPGAAKDRVRLEERVSLMIAAGQREQAATAFRAFIQNGQADMDEASFRWFAAHAEDWGLPSPLESLDAAKPVPPAFLAYLQDRQPADAPRFHTDDPVGFRAALGLRWRARESQLSAEQVRRWMKDLWVQGAAPLPRARTLEKLGSAWPHAVAWLDRQETDRAGAVDALEEALNPASDPARFFARLDNANDADRILAVRVRLARKESAQAVSLADGMLAELRKGEGLSYQVPAIIADVPADEGGEAGDPAPAASQPADGDTLMARLRAWLTPFREAKSADAVEAKFRDLLKERRAAGNLSTGAWQLAFELAPAPERSALAQELDEAWFRGDVAPEQAGALAETLAATLPSESPRWLDRWPQTAGFAQAQTRARVLTALHQPQAAARALIADRRASIWTMDEEAGAFDAWRKLGAPGAEAAPAAWRGALPAWQGKADEAVLFLDTRLNAQPADFLAARAALRSITPADRDALDRSRLAMTVTTRSSVDGPILDLRAARGFLARSPQAARAALNSASADDLARILVRRRYRSADINAALGDLARIAFQTGDEAQLQSAFKALSDRHAPNAKALRAELVAPAAKAEPFRMVDGRPVPIRPRDLTWSLLTAVLKTEGVR
ncbi:MAG TPA: hypothetical protein VNV60_06150 [Holophagaceae bacterium]|nr:hypothetical protein [Holophagaceae bacterium]